MVSNGSRSWPAPTKVPRVQGVCSSLAGIPTNDGTHRRTGRWNNPAKIWGGFHVLLLSLLWQVFEFLASSQQAPDQDRDHQGHGTAEEIPVV